HANHNEKEDKGGTSSTSSTKGKSASKRAKVKATACTIRSKSKLKANPPKNGRIQVEFEVESHVTGQVWNVLLTDNGRSFFERKTTTKPPSGEFEVRAFAPN